MKDRQRILAILAREQPDCVPWCGDLTYWAHGEELKGIFPSEFQQTRDFYTLHERLGIGFYLQGHAPYRTITEEAVTPSVVREGRRRISTVTTPVGTLTEIAEALPESATTAIIKHWISSPDDLPAFRWWFEHPTYEADYAEALKRQDWVDNFGVVLCYMPKSPFMQLAVLYAGVETVVDLWMDGRDEFEAALELLDAKNAEACQLVLESPAECIMIPENLSSEVVGKNFYETYVRLYHERRTSAIRDAGKSSFIHMDGMIEGLVAEVAGSGFDVIEAVTPSPVGDSSLNRMRELTGPDTILWGGLPGIYFTPLIDDDEFENYVKSALEVMRNSPDFVLGVADRVPPDGTEKRIIRVGELVDQFGWY